MSNSGPFSPDYTVARQRFRQAATSIGWQLERHAIGATGPSGEDLTIDVASSPGGNPQRVLVVSSGLHGVEGFFGSAVQLAWLQEWSSQSAPAMKCVLLHGLNPFGFAWLRRFDENNVDLNRNFLLTGQKFEGSPPGYAVLDKPLNPRRPPTRWEPFKVKALWAIARHGMPALPQTVASGQYEFPHGLFFGGTAPSRTHQLLDKHFGRWLRGAQHVVHIDFHTGLGRKGLYKLLLDYPPSELQRTHLATWFGADSFETCESNDVAYHTRGGFGQWCVARYPHIDYLFVCAEFGTYRPIQMLAGLRAENQAHQWGELSASSTIRAKHRLKELFCPKAKTWRSQVLDQGIDIVDRAIHGLAGITASSTSEATRVCDHTIEPKNKPDASGLSSPDR